MRKKMHRLPNGFGSIKKLGGVRRKPYGAYPPTVAYHDNGTPVSRKAIGYYETYQEAFKALTLWNAHPLSERMSFQECYDAYIHEKYNGVKKYAPGTKRLEEMAFRRLTQFHERSMDTITASDLQTFVDNMTLRYSGTQSTVNTIKQVFSFAEKNDIIRKNPARFLRINISNDDEHGVPFSQEEIKTLWGHNDCLVTRAALAMIYSGFRVGALYDWEIKEDTIYGGVKTGKRTVPIHPAIQSFVREIKMPSISAFRRHWSAVMQELGMDHTPHDCRHTFSWLCDTYNVDTISKHMLMGHALGKDVEAKVYSHRTIEQLREEIEKIVP